MMFGLTVEGKQNIQVTCSARLVGTSLGSLIPLHSTLPNLSSPPSLPSCSSTRLSTSPTWQQQQGGACGRPEPAASPG